MVTGKQKLPVFISTHDLSYSCFLLVLSTQIDEWVNGWMDIDA